MAILHMSTLSMLIVNHHSSHLNKAKKLFCFINDIPHLLDIHLFITTDCCHVVQCAVALGYGSNIGCHAIFQTMNTYTFPLSLSLISTHSWFDAVVMYIFSVNPIVLCRIDTVVLDLFDVSDMLI